MPNCAWCGKPTPVTRFFLVRFYENYRGWWLYFCGKTHLTSWVGDGMKGAYEGMEPDVQRQTDEVWRKDG